MSVVPYNKRGHHGEFALTANEVSDLISFCKDDKTRAMLILASKGVPVRGIVAFQAVHHLTPLGIDILGITLDVIPVTGREFQALSLYPNGFDVTGATIWRRIKKIIVRAKKEGVIDYDKDHIPYPASLAFRSVPQSQQSSRQIIEWALHRVHALQASMPNAEFGTVAECPHKDCEVLRRWLGRSTTS